MSNMLPDLTEVGKYFHEMFKFRGDEYRRSNSALVVNPTKRRKKYTEEEGLIYKPLDFEIHGNISAFGIFEISRLAVFEKFLRRTCYFHLHLQTLTEPPIDSSSPADTDLVSTRLRSSDTTDVPKVVKMGVRSVFELIKGSKVEHPNLCIKAVNSLLTLLEGLQLEALSDEPSDIINDIFNVLLTVVKESLNEKSSDPNHHVHRLVELSSATLLSFAIIRGDTGKMLAAISSILTSKYSTAHKMILPNAVIELQKSVQSVITGKLQHPSWFTHGVLQSSCISSFRLLLTADNMMKVPLKIKNITCDGYFLYIYSTYGLYKIGTGYNGTIPRHIYAYNPAFFGQESGWIGYIKKNLYFVLIKPKSNYEFYTVNSMTLELQNMLRIDANMLNLNRGSLFVNDDYLCSLSLIKEDTLSIRYIEVSENKATVSPDDMQLKLSQKYFKLIGSAVEGDENILSKSIVGISEEIVSFAIGKEFSLLQTADGKVLYNGKLGNQNIGIPGSKNIQCWVELTCPRMSVIRQCVTGNEGSIALLVCNDGNVSTIGIAKRGEDGENGVIRRQTNQVKPKRMARMEGKNVTFAACNHGSTALVTDKGELYMFGKDVVHCEPGTGLVSDLKHVRVRQVALGKVHVVVLTDKGRVFTFGYNGRGQCGRSFPSDDPSRYENHVDVHAGDDETSASSEESYADIMCPKGTHVFKQEKCMICPLCHQCTGYGTACAMAGKVEDREPGEECGCGDGDSGCAKCCICKMCAFEEDPEQEFDDDNDADDLIKINLFGAVYERNERKSRAEFLKRDKEGTASLSKQNGITGTDMGGNANILVGDSMSMVYLSPDKVSFRTTVSAIQISAGLYHSVVLMENGEVYTFGSNAMGQLGVIDVNHVGPIRANLPPVIVQIAAGSNHTVALTATGEVYTFGNNSKNQLGDHIVSAVQIDGVAWNNVPQLIPEIGALHQKKAVGIGASGDLTYLKISESFVNKSTLNSCTFVADKNQILMLPVRDFNNHQKPFDCVVMEKISANFKSFHHQDQVDFISCAIYYDIFYNVLWSVKCDESESVEQCLIVSCFNVIASEVKDEYCSPNILDCELAVPVVPLRSLPCYQTAIHVLACLDMLAQARSSKDSLKSLFIEQKRVVHTRSLRKEEFSSVNRFQTLNSSWTYNTPNAAEAIQFSCDTDVLLGGIGLYGGRGHYHVKIKLFDMGFESDCKPADSHLLISTEEIVYECALKQTYSFYFEEPFLLQKDERKKIA